jgi:hypothetical protein
MTMKIRRFTTAVSALIAAVLLLSAAACSGTSVPGPPPQPAYPWGSQWFFDFGSEPGVARLTYTNVTNPGYVGIAPNFTAGPISGSVAPFTNTEFQVNDNGCATRVEPGAQCTVTVAFNPQPSAGPLVDTLQLQFVDAGGNPVTTPSLKLFAQGAEYVADKDIDASGYMVLGNTQVNKEADIPVSFEWGAWPLADQVPDLAPPWSVKSSSCAQVLVGQTQCIVTVAFKPTDQGVYDTPLNMSFADPYDGTNATVQNITLIGRAV